MQTAKPAVKRSTGFGRQKRAPLPSAILTLVWDMDEVNGQNLPLDVKLAAEALFFDSVKQHDSFFVAMLSQNGMPGFRKRFLPTRRRWHETMTKMNLEDFKPIINSKLLAITFVAILMSLIEYWLTEDRERNSGIWPNSLLL